MIEKYGTATLQLARLQHREKLAQSLISKYV